MSDLNVEDRGQTSRNEVEDEDKKASTNEEYFIRDVDLESINSTLQINQKWIGDVGVVVWDAAIMLSKHLDYKNAKSGGALYRNTNVLEIGAGTGLCGLAAAAMGANVILTDLEELVPLLNLNCKQNYEIIKENDGEVSVQEWRWGDFSIKRFGDLHIPEIDLVLASDCIYYEESLDSLYASIEWLCIEGDAKVLFSYEDRPSKTHLVERFFSMITKNEGLTHRELDEMELHPFFQSQDLHLYEIKAIMM